MQLVVFKEIMARYLTNSSCQSSNQNIESKCTSHLASNFMAFFFFFFFLTSIWAFDVKIIHDFWKVYLYVSNQL